MSRSWIAILFATFLGTIPVSAQPPRSPDGQMDRGSSIRTAERWLRQLSNDLDHLEEDLYYGRGDYPADLRDQVDRVARSVAHFQQTLRERDDQRHLRRDFQEMDKQVHGLVNRLNQSNDTWLRRQATRITYADEQVHFSLQQEWDDPKGDRRELLARQSHLLELGARDLEALAARVNSDQGLRVALHEFVEHVDHFRRVVEKGGDRDHLRADFKRVDESWHDLVDRINRSSSTFYLRMSAQNVNRIHNQITDLIHVGHQDDDDDRDRDRDRARVERPVPEQPAPPPPSPPRRRPAIEFEIPGIGRFQIPR